jgi:hypothetical protein
MVDKGRMPNRGSFKKGDPRAGRPKGSENKVTKEARELAQLLVTDERYLECLKQRLMRGRLSPPMDVLWHYAFERFRRTLE